MLQSPLNPSLFTSQATNSPSKVTAPSRKQRNQPTSRVHDIEFATEISTSLLAQVRQLQALLAEREEALRTVNLEKSRLELEAEGYAQRIRALDESEERYKDENWALETRTQELMGTIREAMDRETKLNSNLSAMTNDKSTIERELEDLKQVNAKLVEDNAAAQKANDTEVHQLRRNLNSGDAEKAAMQQKLHELNSQNEELAKAVAMRLRQQDTQSTRNVFQNSDSDEQDNETPENSPPPSPNKFTPRHNHLETETLRSSLGHAHRMIQNLKSTIHREKTEKIELKRMLQDARDEVEQRRREGPGAGGLGSKRQKAKPEPAARKAPRPDLLGAGRRGTTEVDEIQDTDWEDNSIFSTSPPNHLKSPSKPPQRRLAAQSADERSSDAYQTATENDDAFETANERDTTTESEAFQTGVESMADESSGSDDLTETEETVNHHTPRGRVSSSLLMAKKAREQAAYNSTASTSASEDEDAGFSSPTHVSSPRRQLRMRRSVLRRVRPSGEAPMASNSRPSSARNSPATSFVQEDPAAAEGQSLFAELAELDGAESEEGFEAPSQGSTPPMVPADDSRRPSEVMLDAPAAKPAMVDSGMMTEPWEPIASAAAGIVKPSTPTRSVANESEATATPKENLGLVSAATQWTPLKSPSGPNGDQSSSVQTPPKMAWDDEHAPATGEEGARGMPALEQAPQLEYSSVFTQETVPVVPTPPELSTSYVVGGLTEPVELPAPEVREVIVSSIQSQSTEPVLARLPEPTPVYVPQMMHSTVFSQTTEPVVATLPEPAPPVTLVEQGTSMDVPELSVSSIVSEETEPVAAELPETHTAPVPVPVPVPMHGEQTTASCESPELSVSSINSEFIEPEAPKRRDIPIMVIPELSFSSINSVETTPVRSVSSEASGASVAATTDENAPSSMVSRSAGGDEGLPSAAAAAAAGGLAGAGVVVAEDKKPDDASKSSSRQVTNDARPLSAISGNTSRGAHRRAMSNQADQGAQTILSSKQIDQILMDRVSSRPMSPPDSDRSKEAGISPFATPKAKSRPTHRASAASLPQGQRRPESATSSHVSSGHSHPPLPADHREAILAAEKGEQRPASPAVMGPPLAPASAYRTNGARPRTPHEQSIPSGSTRTTSSRSKLRRESQMSRKSSVSSFASEVDERFNMFSGGFAGMMPNGYAEGTDPRMIQAITQTMIGEFLWKYTRKTVSDEMSSTRHRRYFWVHPYTRTLYWSEQDPQHAGKAQLKTKSVPIEAVRVVSDDNPYPPGLHCRSLEVVSPGRRVRFTATTSQRHETWFNALSYLLLRDSDENGDEQNSITLDDIDEFNPGGFRSQSRQTARMSVSSAQSRTLRNNNNNTTKRAGSAMSFRQSTTPGRASPALSAPQSTPFLVPDHSRQASTGRLSTILNSTIKGSFGRKGRHGYSTSSVNEGGSVHDHPSVDDLRQTVEREQREMDGLENVRACCDGKHDVSSLSRTSRYSPRVNRIHSPHPH